MPATARLSPWVKESNWRGTVKQERKGKETLPRWEGKGKGKRKEGEGGGRREEGDASKNDDGRGSKE